MCMYEFVFILFLLKIYNNFNICIISYITFFSNKQIISVKNEKIKKNYSFSAC